MSSQIHLENFVETSSALPAELVRLLATIKDLDERSHSTQPFLMLRHTKYRQTFCAPADNSAQHFIASLGAYVRGRLYSLLVGAQS